MQSIPSIIIRAWQAIGPITIRTPRDLDALRIKTFILSGIVAVAFLGIAALIARMIAFEGGSRPRDPGKRRLWFWALLVAAVSASFLYNLLAVAPTVFPNLQGRFLTINSIATGITAATYLVFGFMISKIFPTRKVGNWFPSNR